MKIEGYELINFDGYYSNKDQQTDFHQDSGPLLVIERVHAKPIVRWTARIMNGPWCENIAFQHYGDFHQCRKHLARALKENQHIYA